MQLNSFSNTFDFMNSKFSFWVLNGNSVDLLFSHDISSLRKLEDGFHVFNSFLAYDKMNDYAKMSLGQYNDMYFVDDEGLKIKI